MSLQILFDSDFQQKVLLQSFPAGSVMETEKDVLAWRSQWMAQLKSWHSPYKSLVDVTNLSINVSSENAEAIKIALARNIKFFEGLYLKKALGFSTQKNESHELLPFTVFASEDEARQAIGIRNRVASGATDFRSLIQLQNHFKQHSVELHFNGDVVVNSKEQINILKSKLTNNLMQWHSKWNLLIDCSNFAIDPSVHAEFTQMLTYFKALFLKTTVGFSPKDRKAPYPFSVFRSRHLAAQSLEKEGANAGDEAICQSKQDSEKT